MIWKVLFPSPLWQHSGCLLWPGWAVKGLECFSLHSKSLSPAQAAELVLLRAPWHTQRGAGKVMRGAGDLRVVGETPKKRWQLLENMLIVHSLDPVQITFACCAKEKEKWAAMLRANSKCISKQTSKAASRNSVSSSLRSNNRSERQSLHCEFRCFYWW